MRALNRRQQAKARRAAVWEASGTRLAMNFTVADAKALQAAVQGTVVLPTDPSYQDARQGFVPNFQDFPQIIVECAVVSDVVQALAFARRHNLWVVCRAGGHSTAGYSVNSGMVLDVGGLNDVYVDPGARRAVVGAGCTFGKLNAALDLYGLHVPGGGCSDVAVAGYAQGGGYGLTSLMFGMHSDNLEAAQVVLADGALVRVDESTNSDLFWALCGGTGNNFGVVVQLTYRLTPLGELWGFSIGFDLDHAPAALDVVQRVYTGHQVPDTVGQEAFLVYVGSEPRYLVRGVCEGSREAGREVMEPLLSLPGNTVDIDKAGGYNELNTELLSTLPDVPAVARSISDSRFLERPLTEAEWAGVVDVYRRTPNNGNFIGFEAYGGRIADVPIDKTAYIHRTASFNAFSWVFWMDESERGPAEAWLDELIELLAGLGNGEAYQNYPRRANTRFAEMYWGAAFPTLQAVKHKYDRSNFFHYEQSITPPGKAHGATDARLLVDTTAAITRLVEPRRS